MKNLGKVMAVLLVCIVAFGAVVVFNPEGFSRLLGNTTLSIDQIYVEPQDSQHVLGDEFYGAFWDILVYVNLNDQLAGVVLPEGQTGTVTYDGAVKTLHTGAKIELKIDAGEAYLIRDLVEKQDVVLAPIAVGSSNQVGAVQPRFYDWAEPTFRIYTPIAVTVYKDGVYVATKTLGVSQAITETNTVPTNEGTVIIQKLGMLSGQYTSFSYTQPIIIMDGNADYVFDRYAVNNYVGTVGTNTYANFWYGASRNSQGQAFNPLVIFNYQPTHLYKPSEYGGWSGADISSSVTAVQCPVFPSQKTSEMTDSSGVYAFTEFLTEIKNIPNLSKTTFQDKASGSTGALWQDVSLVNDPDNNKIAMKMTIPWGAFGTPLVNIRIPTELADSWIDMPAIPSADISAKWETSGTTGQQIYGSNRIACTVTNTNDATATVHLAITSGNPKLAVTPLSMDVPNLVKNVPQTVYFDATNLGVESQVSSIPVTITASDPYSGMILDTFGLSATLMPTLPTGTTTLHLTAYEEGTDTPAKLLAMVVSYAGESYDRTTTSTGEVTMTLTTPQGGAYTGQVTVVSAETVDYYSHTQTYNINTPSLHDVTFEVTRKDAPPPKDEFPLLYVLLALVAIMIPIATFVAYKASKPKSKPKIRRK